MTKKVIGKYNINIITIKIVGSVIARIKVILKTKIDSLKILKIKITEVERLTSSIF